MIQTLFDSEIASLRLSVTELCQLSDQRVFEVSCDMCGERCRLSVTEHNILADAAGVVNGLLDMLKLLENTHTHGKQFNPPNQIEGHS